MCPLVFSHSCCANILYYFFSAYIPPARPSSPAEIANGYHFSAWFSQYSWIRHPPVHYVRRPLRFASLAEEDDAPANAHSLKENINFKEGLSRKAMCTLFSLPFLPRPDKVSKSKGTNPDIWETSDGEHYSYP